MNIFSQVEKTTESAPEANIIRLAFQDDESCTICRGSGCTGCAWLGSEEDARLYWETRRMLAHFLEAA